MSEGVGSWSIDAILKNRFVPNGIADDEDQEWSEKEWGSPAPAKKWPADPSESLASARHEFGEHGGVNMSIEASATFTVMEPDTMRKMFAGELGPDHDFYIYSRHFNPTVLNLSRQMAALEGTEAAYCTASGMSAISTVILQLCPSGSHIVASRCLYGGTHALLSRFLPRSAGIRTTLVDIDDLEAVRAAVEGDTKVIYAETMSNPTLSVADIPGLSAIAREKGLILVVDNTFTPMVVSPAKLGADVVVHSVSKFISGGADIIAGAICGPAKLVNSMMDPQNGALMLLGPTMNAKVAFELSERLPHLSLRMKEHSARGMAYATRMKNLGLKVIYPGLDDHPHHSLLRSMANPGYGFGGMLCVDMGTEDRANRLLHHLQNTAQFGLIAVSLGYYETLMSCSGSSTSSELTDEDKALAGISPGLIRMSLGYSGSADQRWAQFERALAACDKDPALPHPPLPYAAKEHHQVKDYQQKISKWQGQVSGRLQILCQRNGSSPVKASTSNSPTGKASSISGAQNVPPKNLPSLKSGSFVSGRQSDTDKASKTIQDSASGIDTRLVEMINTAIVDKSPSVKWDDVAGLEKAKQTLMEMVILPTKRRDLFTGLRKPPRGLLLFGPPGNGKTMLAKAVASESEATFFNVSASSLTSKWVGEAEKLVRTLFMVAISRQPSVIFMDEIDSLLSTRISNENDASRRLKSEFLVQFDGVTSNPNDLVIVIGATNKPQELDDAVLRRLVKRIYVPLPDFSVRRLLLKNKLKGQAFSLPDSDLDRLVKETEGYSGSDLQALCEEAAMTPIRELGSKILTAAPNQVRPLRYDDLKKAMNVIRPSLQKSRWQELDQWNSEFGSN